MNRHVLAGSLASRLVLLLALVVTFLAPPALVHAATPPDLAGKVVGWGSEQGIGTGGTGYASSPVLTDASGALAGRSLVSVASGSSHSCAADLSGSVFCWGSDYRGALGNGPAGDSLLPGPVVVTGTPMEGKVIVQVDLGGNFTSCALDTAGKAYCWGSADGFGLLGDGRNTDSETPVQVDMSLVSGGAFAQISVGDVNVCGVSIDGHVYCWGDGYNGGNGDGTSSNRATPSPVSTAGVLAGKVLTQVSTGAGTSCALDNAGAAYCWGGSNGLTSMIGDGNTMGRDVPAAVTMNDALAGSQLSQISVGFRTVCAVSTTGRVFCWGGSSLLLGIGVLPANDYPVPSPVAVAADGVLAGKTLTSIATGNGACALDTARAAYCWGTPTGDGGTNEIRTSPVAVDTSGLLAGQRLTAVAAGGDRYLAIIGAPPGTPGRPDAPTAVTGVAGDGQVSLSWTAPVSDGGSAISSYTATASPGGLTCQTTSGTSCTVTGLTNGTSYTFTVTATNAIGTGAPSTSSPAVTPTGPASPPLNVRAFTQNDGTVLVVWDAPTSSGGSPILSYLATADPGSQTCTTATASTLNCFVGGLSLGVPHTFTVQAITSYGNGAPSAPSPSVTPYAPPSAPTTVFATGGDQSATVSWQAPTGDGGSPIIGYTVQVIRGGFYAPTSFTCPGGPVLTCTVTGLYNGIAYTFKVAAYTAWRNGILSLPSATVTPSGPPGAPSGAQAVSNGGTPGTASITVSWTAPQSDGGSPVTGYTATASPGGHTCTTTGLNCTVTGLDNGTTYSLTVTATNANGSGPPSPAAIVTIQPANTTLTLTTSAAKIRAGTVVTISGRLTFTQTGAGVAGRVVTLFSGQPGTGTYSILIRVTTNSQGVWTVTHKQSRSTSYRATHDSSTIYGYSMSPSVTVTVGK